MGDRKAEFSDWLLRHQTHLFGYIYSLVRDLDDADDLSSRQASPSGRSSINTTRRGPSCRGRSGSRSSKSRTFSGPGDADGST